MAVASGRKTGRWALALLHILRYLFDRGLLGRLELTSLGHARVCPGRSLVQPRRIGPGGFLRLGLPESCSLYTLCLGLLSDSIERNPATVLHRGSGALPEKLAGSVAWLREVGRRAELAGGHLLDNQAAGVQNFRRSTGGLLPRERAFALRKPGLDTGIGGAFDLAPGSGVALAWPEVVRALCTTLRPAALDSAWEDRALLSSRRHEPASDPEGSGRAAGYRRLLCACTPQVRGPLCPRVLAAGALSPWASFAGDEQHGSVMVRGLSDALIQLSVGCLCSLSPRTHGQIILHAHSELTPRSHHALVNDLAAGRP